MPEPTNAQQYNCQICGSVVYVWANDHPPDGEACLRAQLKTARDRLEELERPRSEKALDITDTGAH